MHHAQTTRMLALSALLALAACGERDARAGAAAAATTGSEAGVAAEAGDDAPRGTDRSSGDRVEVTLSKPPFAGTHEAAGEMGCMMFNGLWQASLEQDRASGLSGTLVQLKDVPAAGGSTDKVTLSLVFGRPGDEGGDAGVIDVHGAESGGDGRGTVTREGKGAVLRIEGTTHYGAQVAGVIRCATVDFMQ